MTAFEIDHALLSCPVPPHVAIVALLHRPYQQVMHILVYLLPFPPHLVGQKKPRHFPLPLIGYRRIDRIFPCAACKEIEYHEPEVDYRDPIAALS